MSDIRKWFMKQHDKGTGSGNASKPEKLTTQEKQSSPASQPAKLVLGDQESSCRRKTSKYFAADKQAKKDEKESEEFSGKRKAQKDKRDLSSEVEHPSEKKIHKVEDQDDDEDNDFVLSNSRKVSASVAPSKKLKSSSGRGIVQKSVNIDESDDDNVGNKATKYNLKSAGKGRGKNVSGEPAGGTDMDIDESGEGDADERSTKALKSGGRGHGGRGGSGAPAGGRGRGGRGWSGFTSFGERSDPPHKGEKDVPEGASDCLAGLTFVISGTLDSLEREEAEDLIKRYGGRVTGSISKKTNYLLCDEDIGGRKSSKAKELGTAFLTEDGLFDMIRASKPSKSATVEESKKCAEKISSSLPKRLPEKIAMKKDQVDTFSEKNGSTKGLTPRASPVKKKVNTKKQSLLPWTEKYRPKVPNDIIGNQSLVKQLHDWLVNWHVQFLKSGSDGKGKKQKDSGAKKAVLLSGTPGIGKTTSAKLVSQMIGFQTIEVNASDSRGKADAKIEKGVGGNTANSIKELISNEALSVYKDGSKHPKTVLIMDEVDGMSAGDRGGVADLIASIKISKIPIICICNDRYSQKLKSLVNYCLLLSFRKPTKQQMSKRLLQIANAEGIQVNEIALEELAERSNGDMRMALNHLQYMSLSMSVVKYDDIRHRLLNSSKDEDISPFTAVDKLFGFNSGKLRMDERIDLSMSDPDLVPLLIQENYMNYRPSSAGKDDNGIKRMSLIARAAESIADGDIINVQIRRYRQWQLSQFSSLASCIIPAALLHGQRETLEQGERNFNRFGGWLGKNSTTGKNYRLLEDFHVHVLASRESNLGRTTLRLDYLTLLLKQLTDPLRLMHKDDAVQKVVEFMDSYSITQEDFNTVVEISKFQGHPNPLDGIQPAVKAALTKAYNKGNSSRVIRTADMITLPGLKKAPKKRIAAILEPVDDGLIEENGDALVENGEDSSDTDQSGDEEEKMQADLQCLNSKGIQVELKGAKGTGGNKRGGHRGRVGSNRGGRASGKKK